MSGVPQTFSVTTDVPIPIYPSGGQGMVTVVNNGEHDVVLSNEANTLMRMPLASGGSIQWNPGMPLYAFLPGGGLPTVVVVFPGAITLAPGKVQVTGDVHADIVGPVSAEIIGPVTAEIDGPVNVQGSVSVGNIVNTEVTNTITAEVANIVTVEGDVNATVTGDVNATITGPVSAEIVGPVDASITGPVDVRGNVSVDNVINTEVTNTVTAEVANIVTVEGDVNATVTGDVNATITGPVSAEIVGPVTAEIDGPVNVQGSVSVGNVVNTEVTNTVNAEIANVVTVEGDVTATVTGNVNAAITGPVSANIAGPVTVNGGVNVTGGTLAGISAPVTIQNGSVPVLTEYGTISIAPNGTYTRSLGSALARFPSYYFSIGLNTVDSAVAFRFGNFSAYEVKGTLFRAPTNNDPMIATTGGHNFSGPNLFGSVADLAIYNRSNKTVNLRLLIYGQQNPINDVRTELPLAWYDGWRQQVTISAAATYYCYLGPTYNSQTYRLAYSASTPTITDGFIQYFEQTDAPPSWRNFSRDVLRAPDGSILSNPAGYRDITVPPTGVPMRLSFTASGNGANVIVTRIV